MKIESTDAVEGDKRQHLPFKCTDTCKCGEVVETDYSDESYLSYPRLAPLMVVDVHFYCGKCDREWNRRAQLQMNLVAV